MRWSDRGDADLDALLHGEEAGTKLGAALAELREQRTEPSDALRERVRAIAADAEERRWTPEQQPPFYRRYRFRVAHVAAAAAALLVLTVAMSGILALSNATDDEGPARLVAGPQSPPEQVQGDSRDESGDAARERPRGGEARRSAAPPPPPAAAESGSAQPLTPSASPKAAPVPSATRAQDYSARIVLHVADHDELSESVQSAIRSTRELGGYVTYVDYGTSGSTDGRAELAVRIPVGRVQTAVARFSELGTILEQQTEIVDLQGRIDRITRDIQRRRDRIAKLEAQLRDPNLSEAERDRLEARVVQAKRGLAQATRDRAGVLRQSRFAKLDLAFTTEERKEPAPPPSDLRRTLDDATGILVAELGVLLYVLIAGAPFIVLALLAWLGARAVRRGANQRVLERA